MAQTDPQAAWLPIGHQLLANLVAGRLIHAHVHYQVIEASGTAKRILLAKPELAAMWEAKGFLPAGTVQRGTFGARKFAYLISDASHLVPIESLPKPGDINEMIAFAASARRAVEVQPTENFATAVYCESLTILLPVPELAEQLSIDVIIGRYMTGGVLISCLNTRRILSLLPALKREGLDFILQSAGLGPKPEHAVGSTKRDQNALATKPKDAKKGLPKTKPKQFELVGRPALEAFFREHVIEVVEDLDRYQKLGIGFPGGIVLHGPPGCGKTYAVEQLVEYLDWPVFNIDSSSIGSPYIHETGRKIAGVFDEAIEQAPSIIVIDEMEAFLANRESEGGHFRVEEVAEFLRRIPQAIDRKVLIVGMTNRPDLLDPAILRRGRFDHKIEVPMATREEVQALLVKLFSERPAASDLPISNAVDALADKPLSDVAFLVRESARLAARAGKDKIDAEAVHGALDAPVFKDSGNRRGKIGFV